MSRKKPSLHDAFHSRISQQASGCWFWTGQKAGKEGYGVYQTAKFRDASGKYVRERIYAHRLGWELFYGPIADGFEVCHRCDTPQCVNPTHLFLGTHADNQADMRNKGRSPAGQRHGNAKITEFDVVAIRNSRETLAVLSERYGLSPQTVSEIKNRKIWQHVPGSRIDDPRDNQFRRGSSHGRAKLKEADIPVIRYRRDCGEPIAEIASDYGVTDTMISNICNRKSWAHVP